MEKATGLLPIKGINAGNVMLLGMGSTLLLNDLPDLEANVMKRTLKKKLKEVLREIYFSDKKKPPFMQVSEYSDDVVMPYVIALAVSLASFAITVAILYVSYVSDVESYLLSMVCVIPVAVFFFISMIFGPYLYLRRWSVYHDSVKYFFIETFLIDEKRNFSETIKILVREFSKIAQDACKNEEITCALSQDNLSLRVQRLSGLLRNHLRNTAGKISILQYVASENNIPKTGIKQLIDEMLNVAVTAVQCGLMAEVCATRIYLFGNKIVYYTDWRAHGIMEPPKGFDAETPEDEWYYEI